MVNLKRNEYKLCPPVALYKSTKNYLYNIFFHTNGIPLMSIELGTLDVLDLSRMTGTVEDVIAIETLYAPLKTNATYRKAGKSIYMNENRIRFIKFISRDPPMLEQLYGGNRQDDEHEIILSQKKWDDENEKAFSEWNNLASMGLLLRTNHPALPEVVDITDKLIYTTVGELEYFLLCLQERNTHVKRVKIRCSLGTNMLSNTK